MRTERDLIAYIRSELQTAFLSITEAQKDILEAQPGKNSSQNKKENIINKLSELAKRNIVLREELHEYLDTHTES